MDFERQKAICKSMVYLYLQTGEISIEELNKNGTSVNQEEYSECLSILKRVLVISKNLPKTRH